MDIQGPFPIWKATLDNSLHLTFGSLLTKQTPKMDGLHRNLQDSRQRFLKFVRGEVSRLSYVFLKWKTEAQWSFKRQRNIAKRQVDFESPGKMHMYIYISIYLYAYIDNYF